MVHVIHGVFLLRSPFHYVFGGLTSLTPHLFLTARCFACNAYIVLSYLVFSYLVLQPKSRNFDKPRACRTSLLFTSIPSLSLIWRFPKMGDPQNDWFIMENPINLWMIQGYPHDLGDLHMYIYMIINQWI